MNQFKTVNTCFRLLKQQRSTFKLLAPLQACQCTDLFAGQVCSVPGLYELSVHLS